MSEKIGQRPIDHDTITTLTKHALWQQAEETRYQLELLIASVQDAVDLLAERKYGSHARSSGHNARLVLERAMTNARHALSIQS